jgi:HAE1 family hydrophobic/amphiphilic exporter-1
LPDDVKYILLRRWSSTDIAVLSFRLGWQGPAADLEDIVDRIIQRRLQALDGVADVQVWGLQRKTLRLEIDPVSLEAYGLTTFRLAELLRRNNLTMSGGALEDGGVRYLLRSVGALRTPEQVGELPVHRHGLRLRDVARIRYEYPPKRRYDRLDSEDAVTMRVYRNSTANVVDVARAVRRTLGEVKRLPGLQALSIFIYHDSSQEILKRLRHVQRSGLLGAALALGILFLFLRHVRITLVLGLAIPLSILATFLFMYLMRETLGSSLSLNLVTLSGLMLSVGMLVDNSVVVLENIARHRQQGAEAPRASLVGAQEVGRAVLVATATSMVVFLPTIFVSTDFTSRIMSEFGLVLCAALLASLLISLTGVPLLSARLLASTGLRPVRLQTWLSRTYGNVIAWTLRRRRLVVLLAAAVFGLSLHLYLTILVPKRDFLRAPQRHLQVTVQTARSMPFEQVKATMEHLETLLSRQRQTLEIRHLVTSFGRDRRASLTVYFRELEHSHTPTRTLQEHLVQTLPELPGVTYKVHGGYGLGGGEVGLSVQVQGPDGEELARLGEGVKEQLRLLPEVFNVETDVDRGDDELHLAVDRRLAQRLELHPRRVAQTVAFAVGERALTTLNLDEREIDVIIQVGRDGELSAQQLANLPVLARNQKHAPTVGRLTTPRVRRAPAHVNLDNRVRTTNVVASLRNRESLSQVARAIRQRLTRLSLPAGYTWQLGRSYHRLTEVEQESAFTLGLAIALIYLIMASLFESLVLPLSIMLTVPFALSGVVLVFTLTGTNLNQMSDLGMLILCGLVVNNGIMLVDAANQLRARGLSRRDALIRSGQQRLRPIVMTVITTVAGLAPMVAPLFWPAMFGPAERHVEIYGPIALVVIGGLCTSTVLTLILLPAVYALFDDCRLLAGQLRYYLRR